MSETSSRLPTEFWNERLFTGAWDKSPLPVSSVSEPATGEMLGKIGMANAESIAGSSQIARARRESR